MTRAQQKRKREEGLGTKIVRRELKVRFPYSQTAENDTQRLILVVTLLMRNHLRKNGRFW